MTLIDFDGTVVYYAFYAPNFDSEVLHPNALQFVKIKKLKLIMNILSIHAYIYYVY